jgi:hypothetical protein
MMFRPLHDRILVRRIEAEDKTPGGIIIPDTAKEKPQHGEVVAVGPGARRQRQNRAARREKGRPGCYSANGRAPRSRSTAKSSAPDHQGKRRNGR